MIPQPERRSAAHEQQQRRRHQERGGALRAMRRHMQFVLQNPYSSLHPRMKVADILAEPLKVHDSVPKAQIPDRVAELMATDERFWTYRIWA